MNPLPILYSFRRCPYAIRARLALMHCGAQCELREVALKNKPPEMLDVSGKGTVPVLVLGEKTIDESIDIMHWAMKDNPSRHIKKANDWQRSETLSLQAISALVQHNDFEFKEQLDKYKYSDRHPEHSQDYYLQQALPFLEKLETLLHSSRHLTGDAFQFADAAIVPFVRQFSMVEPKTFNALPLPKLQHWLANALESELFLSVMDKRTPWHAESGEKPILFGEATN